MPITEDNKALLARAEAMVADTDHLAGLLAHNLSSRRVLRETVSALVEQNKQMAKALENIQIEVDRPMGKWIHLKRVVSLQIQAALT